MLITAEWHKPAYIPSEPMLDYSVHFEATDCCQNVKDIEKLKAKVINANPSKF